MVKVSAAVIDEAKRLLECHPLRAYDSIQLASALVVDSLLMEAGASSVIFLAADKRLLDAARSEGVQVLSPQSHQDGGS
jgi:predicted nucleic acid-binding protein